MGNAPSEQLENKHVDYWWCETHPRNEPPTNSLRDAKTETRNADKLNEMKQEMMRKHDKRRQIIADKRKEIQDLRDTLQKQKGEIENLKALVRTPSQGGAVLEFERFQTENAQLRGKVVELRTELFKNESMAQKNADLSQTIGELQRELKKMSAAIANFEHERNDYQVHITALKDVVKVSKQMLQIRENQLGELTRKISEIEATMAEHKAMNVSEDLKAEYERQLRNIRNLRQLYEDRQRADKKEKAELASQLDDAKHELQVEQKKVRDLEERVTELENDNSSKYDEIKSLQSNLGLTKAECGEYQAEMSIINQLFSQILLGFNNCKGVDLDNLIKLLEENHDLLQDIVNENDESKAMSSTLPKVLLDLINEMNEKQSGTNGLELEVDKKCEDNQETTPYNLTSTSEIVENLPKVWKVLIELLSHHCNVPVNILTEENGNPCYKVVQTTDGQRLVLSVSQTYIRLKDLILEKKSLEKETGRLKQLNTHLETRLQDQEKRLEVVSSELNKTWHIVGKLQKQHQQLHTKEKILRYELAQKRKLLTELKEELEYCREKWQQAREKNDTTEKEWNELRTEFSSRKKPVVDTANDSLESGYSEDRESLTDDDERENAFREETSVSDTDNDVESVPLDEACVAVPGKESVIDVIQSEIQDIENENEKTEVCSGSSSTAPKEDEACVKPKFSEELLVARDERLRSLEEQTKALMSKVTETAQKRASICTKLENLHETYGSKSDSQDTEVDDGMG